MLLRNIASVPLKLRGKCKFYGTRGIHNLLDIHPDVRNAIEKQKPLVALESTIITHGMPYPQNMNTALEVEDLVRSAGALPATIACIDGRLKIGLTTEDVKKLSEVDKMDVLKCSRRDLPYVVANKKCGGTTVAATMIIAHMAGIRIFATGGVGGVHRDGHISLDVSADLVELGRTPVAVVSSGVKSILDIPRTLEYLETQGVSVASYNNDGRFPDFYTRDSGCKAPYNLKGPEEAAALIKALYDLNLKSGMLIGVPIPEDYALDQKVIRRAIDQAYAEALEKGVEGKNVTPFMLAAVAKITKGNSLKANIALIKNNAKVAAEIACALSKPNFRKDSFSSKDTFQNKPMIIGASILDLCLTMLDNTPLALDGATYKTKAKESAGGVGRNLAESILKLHGQASFISVVGDDQTGKSLLELMPKSLRSKIHIDNENTTSICSILFDKMGNCKLCLANMEIHKSISRKLIEEQEAELESSPLIVIDGNISLEAIEAILDLAKKHGKPVFFEPTDMLIAGKPFQLEKKSQQIRLISPNVYELKAIVETLTGQRVVWEPNKSMESGQDQLINDCTDLLKRIENKFDCIVVTLGSLGVLVNLRGNSFQHRLFDKTFSFVAPSSNRHVRRFYKAPVVSNIVNVSGAGDSFSGGFITGLLRGLSVDESIAFGFVAATSALQSESAVPVQYFQNEVDEMRRQEKQISDLKTIDI